MAFKLNNLNEIIDEIEEFWSIIGIDSEEQNAEKAELDKRVIRVFTNYREALRTKSIELEQDISDVMQKHTELLETFDDTDSEIARIATRDDPQETLKERLEKVTQAYEKDKKRYQTLLEKVTYLKSEAARLFEILKIPVDERGEFGELDVKYSAAKIERLEAVVDDMQMDVQERRTKIVEANTQIASLSTELEIEIRNEIVVIFAENSLDNRTIDTVVQYAAELQDIKEERLRMITSMADEITRLWCTLEVDEKERQIFLSSHSTLSAKVVESCKQEIKRLHAMRRGRLPALIEQQDKQLDEYCMYLHRDRPELETSDNLDAVFDANDKELRKLASLQKVMEPFIEMISQREEMLREIDEVEAQITKSQGKYGAKADPKLEQLRRRLKTNLPKHEKRMLLSLIEFKEANGFDLEWDNEPYQTQLAHIMLSDIERKSARSKGRKKSLQTTREDVVGLKTARRRSENNKVASNGH